MIAAILAGGKSSRFGSDKALFEVGGLPMLANVASAAINAGLKAVVVGRARPDNWPCDGVEFINDETERQGPITGLISGLRYAQDSILALACDMPCLSPAALRWLLGNAENHHLGVVTKTSDTIHPLFAIYHPIMLPLFERHLSEGNRSVYRIATAERLPVLDIPSEFSAAVLNVNWNPGSVRPV
jgi:molybdenum cofactor guanylyltransferase